MCVRRLRLCPGTALSCLKLKIEDLTMSLNPRVTVVIPWCDRQELKTTLARNAPSFRGDGAEVIVVNCGGEKERLLACLPNVHCPWIRCILLPHNRFNKCLALNLGIYFARTDCIFVLDADIILGAGVLDSALESLTDNCYITLKRVFETSADAADNSNVEGVQFISDTQRTTAVTFYWADDTTTEQQTFRDYPLDGSRAGTGLIIMKKNHVVAVGGYNSSLQSWGWEDNDLQIRLKRVLALRQIQLGHAIHLSHGDERRALFGLPRDPRRNFAICLERYNHREFLGTYKHDVLLWKGRAIEANLQ